MHKSVACDTTSYSFAPILSCNQCQKSVSNGVERMKTHKKMCLFWENRHCSAPTDSKNLSKILKILLRVGLLNKLKIIKIRPQVFLKIIFKDRDIDLKPPV